MTQARIHDRKRLSTLQVHHRMDRRGYSRADANLNSMTTRRQFVKNSTAAALAGIFGRAFAQPAAQPAVENVEDAKAAEWEVAAPQDHGIAASALEAVLKAGEAIAGLRGLVVVRDGQLIGERYWGGATASDVLAVNSATKSVTSLLVGLALQRARLVIYAERCGNCCQKTWRECPTLRRPMSPSSKSSLAAQASNSRGRDTASSLPLPTQ